MGAHAQVCAYQACEMNRSAPRAVLDTNVVVSALLFARGRLWAMRSAWHSGKFVPLVSRVTTTELVRVLAYPKFKLSTPDQRELLADYLPYCTVVEIPSRLLGTPPCPDPHDVPFLELAVAGKAGYLVTGDGDLHGLKLKACAIVAPEAFMRAFAIAPV
jgi:putative PIN family toxin of toxin-antitoxin system